MGGSAGKSLGGLRSRYRRTCKGHGGATGVRNEREKLSTSNRRGTADPGGHASHGPEHWPSYIKVALDTSGDKISRILTEISRGQSSHAGQCCLLHHYSSRL